MTTTGALCDLCARPSGDDAYICTTDAHRFADALHEITGDHRVHGLAADLDITLARQTATGTRSGHKPTRGSEAPLPIDLRASDAAHALHTTLATWVRAVHADLGSGALPADTLTDMAAWLLPLSGWLRHTPYAAEAAADIIDAVARARRAVDRPAERTYVGPCECGADVYARPGTPIATCRDCGTEWGVAEQHEWLRAAAEDQLMTAAEIARATSRPSALVSASTIRSWAARGRITAHGSDLHGRPTYRLGDALDLLAQSETMAS